jgi:hypothetical protein
MLLDSERIFVRGAIANHDLLGFALTDISLERQGELNTIFGVYRNQTWGAVDIRGWPTVGFVSLPLGTPFLALEPDGNVFVFDADAGNDEIIPGVEDVGPLNGLGSVGELAYAVGMGYQVYRRDAPGRWVSIRQPSADAAHDALGLNAIHGFAADDLYAVGWEGEIWHFDGRVWLREDSPTNFILSSVVCASDGTVYACGRHGVIVHGRPGQWQIVGSEEKIEDFWSIVEYRGEIYIASMQSLFKLSNGDLEEIVFESAEDEDAGPTFYQLSVADNCLCSVGETDVMLYDGSTWTRLPTE